MPKGVVGEVMKVGEVMPMEDPQLVQYLQGAHEAV